MSRAYFTEDQKARKLVRVPWTWEEQDIMRDILIKKGYMMNRVSRVACDSKAHDAWQVERADVPQLVEELFRQRIVAEFQAEGHGKAGIIFGYDYHASSIIDAASRFRKNKGVRQ